MWNFRDRQNPQLINFEAGFFQSSHFILFFCIDRVCIFVCVFIDGLLWDSRDRPLYAVWDLHASYKWRRRVEDERRFQKVKRFKFAVPVCNSGTFTYLLKLRWLSINKLKLYFCYEQYLIIRNELHEKNEMKWCSWVILWKCQFFWP